LKEVVQEALDLRTIKETYYNKQLFSLRMDYKIRITASKTLFK